MFTSGKANSMVEQTYQILTEWDNRTHRSSEKYKLWLLELYHIYLKLRHWCLLVTFMLFKYSWRYIDDFFMYRKTNIETLGRILRYHLYTWFYCSKIGSLQNVMSLIVMMIMLSYLHVKMNIFSQKKNSLWISMLIKICEQFLFNTNYIFSKEV